MHTTTETLPGLTLTLLTLEVPLDHTAPAGKQIGVFAQVVTREGGEKLPYLVFLQGGPGHEAPRPGSAQPVWMERALQEYQVVLLDQRGTGGSTPVSTTFRRVDGHLSTSIGDPLSGLTFADQVDYLTHLRADEIVNDCEAVREALGASTWTVLGQSFGGFTTLHYLSTHPDSLAGALITGGLSAVQRPVEDIYATTWGILAAKSEAYYRRFPADRERVSSLVRHCAEGTVVLPNGDALTPQRLRTIGHTLGASGGAERLHHLLSLHPRSAGFLHDLAAMLPFGGRNPLYAVLHESSYADGVATRWAADRTMPEAFREDPTLLAGEHLHRGVFAEDSALTPWAKVADALAEQEWNQLYFPDRLATADVPVAAAVYHGDAFVPVQYSLETAALLPNCRTWVTNEYEHNGLRSSADVLDHLLGLLHGRRWL